MDASMAPEIAQEMVEDLHRERRLAHKPVPVGARRGRRRFAAPDFCMYGRCTSYSMCACPRRYKATQRPDPMQMVDCGTGDRSTRDSASAQAQVQRGLRRGCRAGVKQ